MEIGLVPDYPEGESPEHQAMNGEAMQYSRRKIDACAQCGATEAPYAYLQDGRHYCVRCARIKLVRDRIRPAGRRDGDLTLDDVLFRELPDPRIDPAQSD